MTIKTTGSEQCRVQHVGPIGRRQYNDGFMARKAVHFGEDLVEGLFAFVMATA